VWCVEVSLKYGWFFGFVGVVGVEGSAFLLWKGVYVVG